MNKTPFFLGDALLLGLASWMIIDHGGLPEGNRLILVVTCVLVGILFSLLPFLADQRASLKREEWSGMANIGEQLQALPDLQRQIQLATSQWQSIQEQGKATVAEADKVAQSMTQESARFLEVMQSIDVAEKEHLRVELEKCKRGERDWLQANVRVLDHVFALHRAAVQSGQSKLIEQITHFQHAVLDVMKRLGVGLHEAQAKASFDEGLHQVLNQNPTEFKQPVVGETLAPGITFQGREVRLPLVKLVEGQEEASLKAQTAAKNKTARTKAVAQDVTNESEADENLPDSSTTKTDSEDLFEAS